MPRYCSAAAPDGPQVDAFARLIDGITNGVSGMLRRFAQGPGQDVLFVLVVALTGLKIVVEEVLEGIDRIISWLEKAIIIVALLAMTAFSFMDYLRREASLESFEIEGGANMAMPATRPSFSRRGLPASMPSSFRRGGAAGSVGGADGVSDARSGVAAAAAALVAGRR